MKKYNKIVVIGPKSIHVENFILLIHSFFNEIVFIGEEKTDFKHITKSYTLNFHGKNPFIIWKNRKKLKSILQKENAEIVHLHSVNRVSFIVSTIINKVKSALVTTTWGSDVLLVPKTSFIAKKMVQKVLNKSDFITADSDEMIETINELSNNENVNKVFYGIEPIKEIKKEKIIYSNRLHNPLYNIDKIIDLFHNFVKNNKEWKLIIGAIGSETEKLKKQVEDLKLTNKVEFVGWLQKEDNISYYKKSLIYISIPDSDGTAVSLLEAMSAGCIPIVNDLKVSHEWIKDEKNGIIKKKNELYVLRRAASLNQKEVSEINQSIINNKATKEIATKEFYQIYKNIL